MAEASARGASLFWRIFGGAAKVRYVWSALYGDALVLRAARAYEGVRPIPRPDVSKLA